MNRKDYSVIVPKDVFPKPSPREMSAAYVLLDYPAHVAEEAGLPRADVDLAQVALGAQRQIEIGRASCRERV